MNRLHDSVGGFFWHGWLWLMVDWFSLGVANTHVDAISFQFQLGRVTVGRARLGIILDFCWYSTSLDRPLLMAFMALNRISWLDLKRFRFSRRWITAECNSKLKLKLEEFSNEIQSIFSSESRRRRCRTSRNRFRPRWFVVIELNLTNSIFNGGKGGRGKWKETRLLMIIQDRLFLFFSSVGYFGFFTYILFICWMVAMNGGCRHISGQL